jgi:hypothetical protein
MQGLHRAPPSNLPGALTGHCVARGRRTCKEWNRTGEGNVIKKNNKIGFIPLPESIIVYIIS